jgi:hypothetical protein
VVAGEREGGQSGAGVQDAAGIARRLAVLAHAPHRDIARPPVSRSFKTVPVAAGRVAA